MVKTQNPKLIKLLDKRKSAAESFERWYLKTKRAFARTEKYRLRVIRLEKAIATVEEE